MINLTRLISLLALVLALLVQQKSVLASFDTEMDSLADRFASGLSSVNQKMGLAEGTPSQLSSNEADLKIQQLYRNIENIFTEARQRSANQRSAIISMGPMV